MWLTCDKDVMSKVNFSSEHSPCGFKRLCMVSARTQPGMEIHLGISIILPTAAGETAMKLPLTDKIDKSCCCTVLNFCCSFKYLLFIQCLY